MKFGVVFPQYEIGNDPSVIRDYTQTTEGLGYDYLLAFDHVLGADPDRYAPWKGPYTYQNAFHEPFVTFAFMAGVTESLEFATGIIILPQRQTALVAKQTASLDVLCGGRFRLGVGVGWNKVEFDGLNENFHNRGKREAEQVELMNLLWTQELVDFEGEYHNIIGAGINPLPVQRPIPVWFGGGSDATLRRMAKLGAGWMPGSMPLDRLATGLKTLHGYLEAEGRDPATFGLDYYIRLGDKTDAELAEEVAALLQLGATHVCIFTMSKGYTPAQHIDAIKRFKAIVS